MSSQIEDFVVVNISKETARVTQTGFGTTCLLGPYYYIADTVKTYTDPADMLTDGFLTTDDLYIAALKHMGQELSPPQFKIAKKLTDVNSKATLAFTGTPSAGTWTLDVGIADATPVTTGNITYNADDDTTLIKAAIEALSGITEVTVTGLYSTGYTIEFTGVDAAADFRVTAISVGSLTGVTAATATMTQYGSATQTWAAALTATIAEDPDWYFLEPMLNSDADTADFQAMAAIIEAELKLMAITSDDVDIYDANDITDIAYELKNSGYDRTFGMYSADEDNFPVGGWIGGQSPKPSGSITWKFKPIAGISADTLTAAQVAAITGKNFNTFETVAGNNVITSEGVVASGEYIDIMRGTDWLQQRMTEDVFAALINNDKIPFTTAGIALIGSIVAYWLNRGVDAGLLTEDGIVINLPALADIPPAEKSLRYLNGITFTAIYAGAIHKVGISGSISAA